LNETGTNTEWEDGITSIQTDITYNTIKHTCREVGRACIIQVCTSTSGNFGLCENIDTSINRKSIINHEACWQEVLNCVNEAGGAIDRIFTQNNLDNYTLYHQVYGISPPTISNSDANSCVSSDNNGQSCIYDMCYKDCGNATESTKTLNCRACRIAESIWGNCEAAPTTLLKETGMHNRIKKPNDGYTTLLSWFAQNTNTEDMDDNCRDTTCGIGFTSWWDDATQTIICVPSEQMSSDGTPCGIPGASLINITNDITNCCTTGVQDGHGNCCTSGKKTTSGNLCIPDEATPVAQFTLETGTLYYPAGTYKMFCIGTLDTDQDNNVACSGRYVIIKTDATIYMDPLYNIDHYLSQPNPQTRETFEADATYTYTWTLGKGWSWNPPEGIEEEDILKWMVNF